MEFYLSFGQLAGKLPNPAIGVFLPVFLIVIVVESVIIMWRSGT